MHQRTSNRICKLLLLTGIAVVVFACQSISYNETVFPYIIKDAEIAEQKPKRLILAHENFGSPSKKYLRKYENKIDNNVEERLQEAGYAIVDNSEFQKAWREATRKYGSPYNTLTSQLNNAAFRRVISYTFNKMRETEKVDAIVFTDLLEQPVVYTGHSNRLAKWHGVSRRLRNKGNASIPTEFDWSQTVPAISLRTIIYAVDGSLLFKSIGGLEVSRQLDARTDKARFVRREKLFEQQSNVSQGVALSLHPFVRLEGYPQQ